MTSAENAHLPDAPVWTSRGFRASEPSPPAPHGPSLTGHQESSPVARVRGDKPPQACAGKGCGQRASGRGPWLQPWTFRERDERGHRNGKHETKQRDSDEGEGGPGTGPAAEAAASLPRGWCSRAFQKLKSPEPPPRHPRLAAPRPSTPHQHTLLQKVTTGITFSGSSQRASELGLEHGFKQATPGEHAPGVIPLEGQRAPPCPLGRGASAGFAAFCPQEALTLRGPGTGDRKQRP